MGSGRYKKGEWSGSYQKIMILAEQGIAHNEIATKVGLSKSRISQIIHDERFIKRRNVYKEKAEGEIYAKFAAVSGDAADKIISIMHKGNAKDRIKLDAAKDILNYAGHKPKEQVEHVTNNYTIKDVESAKQVIEEIRGLQDRLTKQQSQFLVLSNSEKDTKAEAESASESKAESNQGEVLEGTITSSPGR